MQTYYKGNTPMGHFPPPKRRQQCCFLIHKSKLIRATDGSSENYTDSFYYCNKLERRLSTKGKCRGCKLRIDIINGFKND